MSVSKKSFRSEVLRKIRSEITIALKEEKLALSTHYKISAVEDTTMSFDLELIYKSATEQTVNTRIATVKRALKKKFDKRIVMTEAGDNFYVLDIQKEYTKQDLENPAQEKTEKVRKKIGRKKGDPSKLEDELIHHLHTYTKLRQGETGLGFVVQQRAAKEHFVTFSFKTPFAFCDALCSIEAGYADHIKIVDMNAHLVFQVGTEPIQVTQSEATKRSQAFNFSVNLKKAVLSIDEKARVLTPHTVIAYREDMREVEIQFNGPGSAAVAATRFKELHISVVKEGALVRITLIEDDYLRFANEEIVFLKYAQQKGLIFSQEESGSFRYVHCSMNYDEFYFLPFNRAINNAHVNNLVESIRAFGVLSFIIVVETDSIDGVMRKWIVDGQHRFKAFKNEGRPILYTMTEASTKEEIVRLIAKLNCTSRRWSIPDYLHAWASLEIPDYKHLLKE